MNKKKSIIGFAAGLVLGLAVAILSFGDRTMRRLAAQTNEPASHYQVSSWAYPATSNNAGVVNQHRFGAYIVDTRSGKVWSIDGNAAPQFVGQVKP
jgi:hypothetical protein